MTLSDDYEEEEVEGKERGREENGESRRETRKISKDEYDPERPRLSRNNVLPVLPFYTPLKRSHEPSWIQLG